MITKMQKIKRFKTANCFSAQIQSYCLRKFNKKSENLSKSNAVFDILKSPIPITSKKKLKMKYTKKNGKIISHIPLLSTMLRF